VGKDVTTATIFTGTVAPLIVAEVTEPTCVLVARR